jgi:hypothetical protein
VESQLTIGPDVADWTSVIRYDVVGGGLDRIDLKIPAPWAARARLYHSGADLRSPAQVVGPSAFWTISPPRPLWGSHRLVLRSSLPLVSLGEIAFPEVAPLGKQGAVDAYFRMINAAGRPLAAEDATGLRKLLPIFHAARFRDREFARDDGTPSGIYRMEEKSWALRIPLTRTGSAPRGLADEAARVALADVMVTVMPDRSVLGRALYEIIPESGRLLSVQLPAGSTILWASVEPTPAVPLRAGPSAWSIALTPPQPERVCLIWRAPASEVTPSGGGGWSLPLPRAGAGPARALVTVSTPAGVSIGATSSGLEPVAMARLDQARADRLGSLTREALAHVDRSSGRDHERIVSLLISHGQALRAAERAANRAETASGGQAAERELAASIANARTGLDEAVRSAGLTDDLTSARSYLGLSEDGGNRPPDGIPEPIVPCRIRAVGQPTALIGTLKGLDDVSARPSLTVAGTPQAPSLELGAERSAILAAALAVAAIVATSLGGRRAAVASAVSLLLTLAASAVAGGPAMLAGAVGLAALAGLRDQRTLVGPD